MTKNFFKGWLRFRKGSDERKYEIRVGNPNYSNEFRGLEISFYPQWHHFDLKYSVAGYFDSRPEITFSPGWGWWFIHLPFKTRYDECEPPRYGIYYYEKAFWFCWKRKTKAVHMPWSYDWIRTSVYLKSSEYAHETAKDRKNFYEDHWKDKIWYGRYPFHYTRKNGEVQERLATIHIEEREWRQKWLKWTKYFAMTRRTISIEFSDEVGERTGSWKGGTVGCSYELLPKESPLACLRRMERERTFS